MSYAQKIDFSFCMEAVAFKLLGEPSQKHGNEWRYGTRGSMSVDIKKGEWYDHELGKGGGVVELIRRKVYGDPIVWLRNEGFLDPARSHTEPPQVVSRSRPRAVEPPEADGQTEP